MTDEQLRELYARTLTRGAKSVANRSGQCVTPEELLELIRREGTEERRLRILDHVMTCEACRGELDLLRAIDQAGQEIGAATAPERRFQWARFTPLAMAASLLLAVGLVVGVWRSEESPDVPRGGPSAVALVAPAEHIAGDQPVTFVWRPVPNAHQYAFEILEAGSGNSVFSQTTADTVLVLQPLQLRGGRDYQWWVRARTAAGELASPMRPLRVRSE